MSGRGPEGYVQVGEGPRPSLVDGKGSVISKTPFRLTFAGGGTDLPAYFLRYGPGACVAGTIDKGIYVMIVENFNPGEIRVTRFQVVPRGDSYDFEVVAQETLR